MSCSLSEDRFPFFELFKKKKKKKEEEEEKKKKRNKEDEKARAEKGCTEVQRYIHMRL